jgi:hypothetical protein
MTSFFIMMLYLLIRTGFLAAFHATIGGVAWLCRTRLGALLRGPVASCIGVGRAPGPAPVVDLGDLDALVRERPQEAIQHGVARAVGDAQDLGPDVAVLADLHG